MLSSVKFMYTFVKYD